MPIQSFFSTPLSLLSCLLLMVTISSVADDHVKPEQEADKISFYREISPILQANCHGCHQPAKAKGQYQMTKFDRLLAGGGEEAAIIPHQQGQQWRAGGAGQVRLRVLPFCYRQGSPHA
ncbi:MAG TPA: hypothetical protein EYO84_05375, partial [Planctomycetes bacterium]|nr:hypothetical protein [Planctomycetota bacterium]